MGQLSEKINSSLPVFFIVGNSIFRTAEDKVADTPCMPGGGRMLKLRSNLPTGALWSCPTLEIVQYGDEAHAVLAPGTHVITVRHPELNLEQSSTFSVREL